MTDAGDTAVDRAESIGGGGLRKLVAYLPESIGSDRPAPAGRLRSGGTVEPYDRGMDYVTIRGVEIVTVGMKWPTSPVPSTLTFEHLQDMLSAAMDDPHVTKPRLKIGHTDPRFDDVGAHDPFYDGEPAFGTFTNLRLENDGAVLVGDAVEVPQWLADAAPSAWPTRSAEWNWDVETPGGKRYSAVLTGVALGGVWTPAIKDLEDLQRAMIEGPLVEASESDPMPEQVTARADVDKVLQAFFAEYAVDDRYWWWPRSVWTDPNELIVDDDDGHLYRVPYSSDESQTVTFDDPTEVIVQHVDVSNGRAVAAVDGDRGRPARVFSAATEARPPNRASRGGSGPAIPSDQVMDVDGTQIRTALGLPPEASEAEVAARLAERAEAGGGSEEPQPTTPPQDPAAPEQTDPEQPAPDPAPATPEPGTAPEVTPPADPGQPAPEQPAQTAEPVAASEDDTVQVDRATWEGVRRDAAEGAAARAEQVITSRERLLSDAVEAGKFPPARVDHYRNLHKADPDGTEALIEKLATGVVPVDERGSSASDETRGSELGQDQMAALFPGIIPPSSGGNG